MASTYGILKGIWCGLLPKKARHALYELNPFKGSYHAVLNKLQEGAAHEEIYDQDYYDVLVDPPMQESAGAHRVELTDILTGQKQSLTIDLSNK